LQVNAPAPAANNYLRASRQLPLSKQHKRHEPAVGAPQNLVTGSNNYGFGLLQVSEATGSPLLSYPMFIV
jgi:hypothetical protein